MTADRKRSTGPPPSAGVLARYAQAYAREVGVTEGRVRAWVAYMIMAGALERSTGGDGPQFIVKGGVALELRLRDRARATKLPSCRTVATQVSSGIRRECTRAAAGP